MKWNIWYCWGSGYWHIDVEDVHGNVDPITIERKWLEAVHALSAGQPITNGKEIRVNLPDFHVSLYDWRQWTLVLVGWGFAQTSFDVDSQELARIHADTSPTRLDAAEQAGKDEEAAWERKRHIATLLREHGYEVKEGQIDRQIDRLTADQINALAKAGEEIEEEQWAESRRVELESAEGLQELMP